jgi:ferredoxin
MAYQVVVDKDECIGCGNCASICDANFEMKDGKAHVKQAKVTELGCSQEAADACPVQCIKIKKTK